MEDVRWKMKGIALLIMLGLYFPMSAQQENSLNVDFNMMTRGEIRHGGFNELEENNQGRSNFVIGRYRLNVNYSNGWMDARLSMQESGTWGMDDGSFVLNEGWVNFKSPKGWFAKIGRQVLAYDDERIIGSNDWSMTAPTHDVLKLGLESKSHKLHLLFAYNQNPEDMYGTTYYTDGNQPYKSMQTLWYHYDSPKSLFGGSLLFMNIGMQSAKAGENKDLYQQLVGAYLTFKPKYFVAEGSFYYQFGTEEHGIPLEAYMGSVKLTATPRTSFSLFAGYDYLSGDKYFAVPPEGAIGLVFHDKVRGFNPIYGSHHEFYGAMDFFYMSTYVGGFTPGLQNAYIGSSFTVAKKLNFNLAGHYYAMATHLPNVDRFLGLEVDLSASYAFSDYISAECGYSYMHGSETMKFLKRVSDNQHLHWAYLMLIIDPTIFQSKK